MKRKTSVIRETIFWIYLIKFICIINYPYHLYLFQFQSHVTKFYIFFIRDAECSRALSVSKAVNKGRVRHFNCKLKTITLITPYVNPNLKWRHKNLYRNWNVCTQCCWFFLHNLFIDVSKFVFVWLCFYKIITFYIFISYDIYINKMISSW